jgi:hypothetical protein
MISSLSRPGAMVPRIPRDAASNSQDGGHGPKGGYLAALSARRCTPFKVEPLAMLLCLVKGFV